MDSTVADNSTVADIARLSLLIQRLLDAEVLCEVQGAALLAAAEAARRCLEEGDAAATHRHIEQVVRFTEALVQSGLLDREYERAVLEAARRLLAEGAD